MTRAKGRWQWLPSIIIGLVALALNVVVYLLLPPNLIAGLRLRLRKRLRHSRHSQRKRNAPDSILPHHSSTCPGLQRLGRDPSRSPRLCVRRDCGLFRGPNWIPSLGTNTSQQLDTSAGTASVVRSPTSIRAFRPSQPSLRCGRLVGGSLRCSTLAVPRVSVPRSNCPDGARGLRRSDLGLVLAQDENGTEVDNR